LRSFFLHANSERQKGVFTDMAKVLKFWAGLGVAAISTAMAANATIVNKRPQNTLLHLAAAGEAGEAGESGKAVAAKDDQPTFIADLALVEGHMRVGIALYKLGKGDAAMVHMKHPADELYTSLKPMLDARKVTGFADELEALSMAIHSKSAPADVDALFDKMKLAIVKTRGEGESVSAHAMVGAVEILLQNAVADYTTGVEAGVVKVPKEYQDAWGFVHAARAIMADLSAQERGEHAEPLAEIDKVLAGLDGLWPDLAGTQNVTADAKILAVAKAKIELAGLDIK
jgi:hypothetical protein